MVLDERWLCAWRVRICAAADQAMEGPAAAYAEASDGPWTGPPSSPAELADVCGRVPWLPEDLLALHRVVGPVTLADVGNGYFLHPLTDLAGSLPHGDSGPDRLELPGGGLVDIVVFGSDGGGRLYALPIGVGGPVYRLQEAAYVDRVYGGSMDEVVVVGQSLEDFLTRLLDAVERFAATGAITNL